TSIEGAPPSAPNRRSGKSRRKFSSLMTSVPSFWKSAPSANVPTTSNRRPDSSEPSWRGGSPDFPGLEGAAALPGAGPVPGVPESAERPDVERLVARRVGQHADTPGKPVGGVAPASPPSLHVDRAGRRHAVERPGLLQPSGRER